MHDAINHGRRDWLVWILISAAFVRIATLGAYPLADKTEARYAEVAREMVTTGNWVTPQLHGEKFWAKPPLSFWLTAGAMSVFGINEFGARLAPLLLSLIVVGLVYSIAARRRGSEYALAAMAILASSVLFFVSSGAVMTDSAMALGTTLSMVAFWHAIDENCVRGRIWGYLFFIGLVIGLLGKGPAGAVLTFLPIGLWILWTKRWKAAWRQIPWVGGFILLGVLVLPWYLSAEARTPGFLKYFFVGEHWMRFVQPGWTGDLYGSAHSRPHGMIWLFWIIAAFPWSFVFLYSLARNAAGYRRRFSTAREADGWTLYLVLWAFSPMIFFTLAGNILWTYALPGLPAFALLMARGSFAAPLLSDDEPSERRRRQKREKAFIAAGLFTPVIFGLGIVLLAAFSPAINSQKRLISRYQALRGDTAGKLIYLYDRPFSAEFYSSGNAVNAADLDQADAFMDTAVQNFFVVKKEFLSGVTERYPNKLSPIGVYDDFILLGESGHVQISARTLTLH